MLASVSARVKRHISSRASTVLANLAQLNQHNLGESLQALQDDFTLLNHYAASFGHSKILESYLALRLEELKFASLVIGLKQQGTDTTQQVKLAANV